MILCLGTTPAAQRVMVFRSLTLDAVNRAVTTLDGAAGKSINVAKVLQILDGHPVATGFLGGDRGDYLKSVLTERGIEHDFVPVTTCTRQCITVIDKAHGTQTELVEESRPVEPTAYERLMAIVRLRTRGCQAVVMSGTITPSGPIDLYRQCVQIAATTGTLSVVDAQGAPLLEALKAGPGLVKPNRAELAATVHRELKDDPAVMLAMRELGERGARQVIVTAGEAPTLAFDGSRFWRVSSPRVETVNPIGSGDAFTAALTWRLVRGDDLGEACRWAAAAGTANALTLMAGEVNLPEVERLVKEVQVFMIS